MRAALLLVALAAPALHAQTPDPCAHGTATARLNVGGVDAGLFNNGNLFYGDGQTAQYEVPRGSGGTGLYAASVWVGGRIDGAPRTTATTFYGFEFWPGPLDAGATVPPEGCAAFDRIYSVTVADVMTYEATGVATPDLAGWPVGLGADAVDAAGQPVVPTSRNQTIDLGAGQRPVLVGSQTAFWVMNDAGGTHVWSGSAPLGVEVQVMAAAFSGAGTALDQSTVYRFRIINRNTVAIDDAHATFFVDTDLGRIVDEYQGVDVARGMAFTYNGGTTDPQYGVPPAVGYDFLSTGVGAHRYAANATASPTSDPRGVAAVRNTQSGLWNDGTPQTAFGNGYLTTGAVTPYAFPADPVTGQFWSEVNSDGAGHANAGGNKRSIASTPAFLLGPGAQTDVVVAIVFAQGTSNLDSVARLYAVSDTVQAAFDAGQLFPLADASGPAPPAALALSAPRPNPTTGTAEVTLTTDAPGPARVAVLDVLGREVAVLLDGTVGAGTHPLRVDRRLPAGTYLVVATAGAASVTQRLTVAR